MNLDLSIGIVNSVLSDHQNMFESDVTYNVSCDKGHFKKSPDEDAEYRSVRWPQGTTKKDSTGFLLKGNMGTVSLEIIYRKLNTHSVEEVGHSYRYHNFNHLYMYLYDDGVNPAQEGQCNFSFRYDEDFRPRAQSDPPTHLQILEHGVPRFIIAKTTLTKFLETVQATCFDKNMEAVHLPFFANSR